MRIAHAVSTFPPKVGGMGSVCYNEAKRLAERGHDVTVFTLDYSEIIDTEKHFKVIRLKSFPHLGDAGLAPQLFGKLKNFDVVHLHYPFYGGAEWVWLAKIFYKQRYVVTYHMDALPTSLIKLAVQKIYDLILPFFIFKGADKIITVDKEHFFHSKFGRKIPSKKVVEIHNAVDLENFMPHAVDLPKLNLQAVSGKNIILFVGNALKVKRLDVAIEAVSRIENAVLLVVGGGYEIDEYRKMAEDNNLKDKVFFTGYCNDTNLLADYYNIADCVIIPSDAESFSLVALEAMSCAKPLVASDIPALRSRVTDGVDGFLALPGSAEDFAKKISSMLSMTIEQRQIMGENGRKKVVEKFGWEEHIQKLEDVYVF